jgi:hypothetical protein
VPVSGSIGELDEFRYRALGHGKERWILFQSNALVSHMDCCRDGGSSTHEWIEDHAFAEW